MSQPEFDVEFCRAQFPALESASDWALLDNAGGSLTPAPVIERATAHLSQRMVQLGASYPLSVESDRHVDAGRAAAATLVGADADEIVLGSSTTMNIRVLSQALDLGAGDEVIVTNLDHEANIGSWRRLEERGVVLREWKVSRETLRLELEALQALLGPKTRLVCFTQCSNIVGAIHDLRPLIDAVHAVGAKVCIDGVAYAPHRLIDVRALDADFYAFSLYKTYGPHLGALYGKRELLLQTKSQNHYFIGESAVPYKLMPGNVSHELAAAVPGVLDYLLQVHEHHFPDLADLDTRARLAQVFELFAAHEELLSARVLKTLTVLPGVRVIGPTQASREDRAPTLSFVVEGMSSRQVVEALEAHRVALRWGHFYAYRLCTELGLHEMDGVVRASLVHYNTLEEADRLCAGLVVVTQMD